MAVPLHLLIAMNAEDDVLLVVRKLRHAEYDLRWEHVNSAKAFAQKLVGEPWELIISDYELPGFGGLEALALVRKKDPDLPVILLSRGIGEEAAVEAIKAGASDCILADHLDRLPAAVERELRDSELRRSRRTAEADLREKTAFCQDLVEKVHDIAEWKRAQEALRRSEEMLRGIFENTLVGIFQTTPEGRYITVNPACARMFGYSSPEEMIRSVTDIARQLYWDPEERQRCLATLESSGKLERFEVKCRRKDGSPIWTVINSRGVRDATGNLLLIEGVIEDITSRKRTEEALRQSEERFSKAFRSSPVMEAITSLYDGRIVDVNDKWLEALGLYPGGSHRP